MCPNPLPKGGMEMQTIDEVRTLSGWPARASRRWSQTGWWRRVKAKASPQSYNFIEQIIWSNMLPDIAVF